MDDEILFESLEEGSFDGIVIPVQSIRIRTGSRKAFHVFPFRPGHDIEHMGREAVSGTISAVYVNGLEGVGGSNDLWPGAIELLRNRVQEQKSGPLVIPTLGKIPFAAIDIDESYTEDFKDGCRVTIVFTEDSGDQFTSLKVSAKGKLGAAASAADTATTGAGIPGPNEADADGEPLTTFSAWTNNILGQIDQAGERLALPIRQLDRVAQSCNDILATVSALRTPGSWEVADALRELAATCQATAEEVTRSLDLTTYTTRVPTNASAIARATSNSVEELLNLNDIADANDIAAGETLLVFVK